MKRKIIMLLLVTLIFTSNVFAATGYVTKQQLEALGKSPYSVDYRYQADYIVGKPVPETALNYKKPTDSSANTSTTVEDWSGEYKWYPGWGVFSRTMKISQNGNKITATVINDEYVNLSKAWSKVFDLNSTTEEVTDSAIESMMNPNDRIPARTLFTATGTLDGNTVWLYPGKNYAVKLVFDKILNSKKVIVTDNTSKLGKNPFNPNGTSIEGTFL